MEKFRIIIGERKGESRRELAELAQEIRQATAEGSTETAVEQRSLPKETADVGQFMRYVASTIAKLQPEERTFVKFLIDPKATPLVMNDRMIEMIYKVIDLLEEPHIEALSKTISPDDLVKLAEKFNTKLAALIAILAERCRPSAAT
ncbi:MAG: hypothetical protein QXK71_02805 [Pyrobaculum sp.]